MQPSFERAGQTPPRIRFADSAERSSVSPAQFAGGSPAAPRNSAPAAVDDMERLFASLDDQLASALRDNGFSDSLGNELPVGDVQFSALSIEDIDSEPEPFDPPASRGVVLSSSVLGQLPVYGSPAAAAPAMQPTSVWSQPLAVAGSVDVPAANRGSRQQQNCIFSALPSFSALDLAMSAAAPFSTSSVPASVLPAPTSAAFASDVASSRSGAVAVFAASQAAGVEASAAGAVSRGPDKASPPLPFQSFDSGGARLGPDFAVRESLDAPLPAVPPENPAANSGPGLNSSLNERANRQPLVHPPSPRQRAQSSVVQDSVQRLQQQITLRLQSPDRALSPPVLQPPQSTVPAVLASRQLLFDANEASHLGSGPEAILALPTQLTSSARSSQGAGSVAERDLNRAASSELVPVDFEEDDGGLEPCVDHAHLPPVLPKMLAAAASAPLDASVSSAPPFFTSTTPAVGAGFPHADLSYRKRPQQHRLPLASAAGMDSPERISAAVPAGARGHALSSSSSQPRLSLSGHAERTGPAPQPLGTSTSDSALDFPTLAGLTEHDVLRSRTARPSSSAAAAPSTETGSSGSSVETVRLNKALRQQLLSQQTELSSARNVIAKLTDECRRLTQQLSQTRSESLDRNAELHKTRTAVDQQRPQLEAIQAELTKQRRVSEEAQQQLSQRERQLSQAVDHIHKLQHHVTSRAAELTQLREDLDTARKTEAKAVNEARLRVMESNALQSDLRHERAQRESLAAKAERTEAEYGQRSSIANHEPAAKPHLRSASAAVDRSNPHRLRSSISDAALPTLRSDHARRALDRSFDQLDFAELEDFLQRPARPQRHSYAPSDAPPLNAPAAAAGAVVTGSTGSAAGPVSERYRNKHQNQTYNIFSQFDGAENGATVPKSISGNVFSPPTAETTGDAADRRSSGHAMSRGPSAAVPTAPTTSHFVMGERGEAAAEGEPEMWEEESDVWIASRQGFPSAMASRSALRQASPQRQPGRPDSAQRAAHAGAISSVSFAVDDDQADWGGSSDDSAFGVRGHSSLSLPPELAAAIVKQRQRRQFEDRVGGQTASSASASAIPKSESADGLRSQFDRLARQFEDDVRASQAIVAQRGGTPRREDAVRQSAAGLPSADDQHQNSARHASQTPAQSQYRRGRGSLGGAGALGSYHPAHSVAPFATDAVTDSASSIAVTRPSLGDDRPIRPAPATAAGVVSDGFAVVSPSKTGRAQRRFTRDDRAVGLSGVQPPSDEPAGLVSSPSQRAFLKERSPDRRGRSSIADHHPAGSAGAVSVGSGGGRANAASEARIAEAERKLLQLNMERDTVLSELAKLPETSSGRTIAEKQRKAQLSRQQQDLSTEINALRRVLRQHSALQPG